MTRMRAVMLAVGLISLLVAGSAVAKPKKGGKVKAAGMYRLEIDAEQLTTWNYNKEQLPQCDYPTIESGRQYLQVKTYDSGEAAKPLVKVTKGPKGGVKLKFVRKDLTLSAEAELERNYDILYSQISDCPNGEAGGDGTNQNAVGTNHCTANGSLDFFFGSKLEEVANPLYPTDLEGKKAPKAPIYFGADPYWLDSTSSDHNLPSACDATNQGQSDLGLDETQGEWPGALIPVVGSLPAKKLLGSKSKVTKVSFGRTVNYPNAVQTYAGPPHTTGKTRVDVTLTFKRVGK